MALCRGPRVGGNIGQCKAWGNVVPDVRAAEVLQGSAGPRSVRVAVGGEVPEVSTRVFGAVSRKPKPIKSENSSVGRYSLLNAPGFLEESENFWTKNGTNFQLVNGTSTVKQKKGFYQIFWHRICDFTNSLFHSKKKRSADANEEVLPRSCGLFFPAL